MFRRESGHTQTSGTDNGRDSRGSRVGKVEGGDNRDGRGTERSVAGHWRGVGGDGKENGGGDEGLHVDGFAGLSGSEGGG